MRLAKEAPTLGVSRKGKKMERVSSNGTTVNSTLVSGWPAKDMESACGALQKEIAIWENGRKA